MMKAAELGFRLISEVFRLVLAFKLFLDSSLVWSPGLKKIRMELIKNIFIRFMLAMNETKGQF